MACRRLQMRVPCCTHSDASIPVQTIRDAEVPIRTYKPVPKLTTEGPFRLSRNPGYLSFAIVYAGIALLRNSLWAILLLPLVVIVMQREVIGREEQYLEAAPIGE